MTRSQRRAHLIVWLLLGPICIGTVLLAVITGPAPLVPEVKAGGPGAPP
jgi:hypothetical protein